MMKFYSCHFYVFIALVYVTGRFCLVANYENGQEDKRVIHFHVLPQTLIHKNTCVTGEGLTASHIQKFSGGQLYFSPEAEAETVSFNTNLPLSTDTYAGKYIDPPPLWG